MNLLATRRVHRGQASHTGQPRGHGYNAGKDDKQPERVRQFVADLFNPPEEAGHAILVAMVVVVVGFRVVAGQICLGGSGHGSAFRVSCLVVRVIRARPPGRCAGGHSELTEGCGDRRTSVGSSYYAQV